MDCNVYVKLNENLLGYMMNKEYLSLFYDDLD